MHAPVYVCTHLSVLFAECTFHVNSRTKLNQGDKTTSKLIVYRQISAKKRQNNTKSEKNLSTTAAGRWPSAGDSLVDVMQCGDRLLDF